MSLRAGSVRRRGRRGLLLLSLVVVALRLLLVSRSRLVSTLLLRVPHCEPNETGSAPTCSVTATRISHLSSSLPVCDCPPPGNEPGRVKLVGSEMPPGRAKVGCPRCLRWPRAARRVMGLMHQLTRSRKRHNPFVSELVCQKKSSTKERASRPENWNQSRRVSLLAAD